VQKSKFVNKEPEMSKNQHLSVEDCYARGSSPFRTVIMAAQEARFINEQSNLGFIKLSEKPTTIAIQKFRNLRLAVVETEAPATSDDLEAPAAAEAPAA
jgi:DNA-directed RNA polymerase subunit K/omega